MADRGHTEVASGTAQKARPRALFVCAGDAWRVHYAGTTVYVRDSKGMRYLAYLLARPHVAVDARLLAEAATHAAVPPGEPDGAAQQRARSAVSKRIRAAVGRITEHHLALGRHLSACVHTGAECRYSPDPREPQEWTV
jgi:hypothetical protein